MNEKTYVNYMVPPDVDARIQARRARIAERRGIRLTKVTKSGDVLRELLAIAEAAELLGIRPVEQPVEPVAQ